MPFKDLLKKKEKVEQHQGGSDALGNGEEPVFLFLRSTTNTQEIITPPTFSSQDSSNPPSFTDGQSESKHESRTSRLFGRSRSASVTSNVSASSRSSEKSKSKRRLSQRLHLRKSEVGSASVPADLPEITVPDVDEEGEDEGAGLESQWEKRATMLARKNEQSRSRPTTPVGAAATGLKNMGLGDGPVVEKGVVSTKYVDDNIQEAIRLHEAGEFEISTKMFGRLADPKGENNALSQVLYGLALRHGWGCTPDAAEAVKYLSAAAANAASIEDLALQAGMKKGGAAKGELVLAIFELANCFRHGWGVQVDKIAAKQYYETAANLGDTDAMNEVAWCYVEGFGCKKDKYAAAKYYRLAELGGSKTLGNSWIWKDKYGPPNTASNSPPKK